MVGTAVVPDFPFVAGVGAGFFVAGGEVGDGVGWGEGFEWSDVF